MPKVWISAEVDTTALVVEIHGDLTQEQAIQFILDLDLEYADLEFTTKLYARLGDVLREELESDAG